MTLKNLVKIFLEKAFSATGIFLILLVCIAIGCTEKSTVISSNLSSVNHEYLILEDGNKIAIKPSDRIYFLVRHAEKDTLSKTDPDLTPIGYERSYRLAEIMKAARIDQVYSTVYLRTLMTADSTAKSKGMSIKTYDPKELKSFAERLKAMEGHKRFLLVGHSNTTPMLSNHIHGSTVLEGFDESDYDNLIAIIQGEGKESQLHQLKFKPQTNTDN